MQENILEINKAIVSSDTKEVIELLESLDENSKVLAKTYLSALVDKQQLDKSILAIVAV